MRKHVHVVSYFTPPILNAESILVWKTINELINDFDVSIQSTEIPEEARIDSELSLSPRAVVNRSPHFKPRRPLLRKLADKTLGLIGDEQLLWALFGKWKPIDCDVIYSRSHPPASHILAYRIKQAIHKPWIAQFSDPWTRNPYHTKHTSIRKRFDAHWEQLVLTHADALIFPTKEILEIYHDAYKSQNIKSKSIVLPHHYIPELYHRQQEVKAEGNEQTGIRFAYFGDFYGVRSPEPLIQGLHLLATRSPSMLSRVSVNFYGNVESKFADIIQSSPVKIHQSKVSYFESLHRMTDYDVLLLIDAPSENGVNPFLASKLVDYLGAGKRILGVTDEMGTAAEILRTYGHLVVSPHNTEEIANAIATCIDMSNYAVAPPIEFTTQAVVQQLAGVMRSLMAP